MDRSHPRGSSGAGRQGVYADADEPGAKVVVCSARCRAEEGYEATVEWLEKHDFPPVTVSHGKPIVDYYVDDRAVKYDGDWGEVASQIERPSKST